MAKQHSEIDVVKNNLVTIFKIYEELNLLLSNQDKRSSKYLECKKYFEQKKYLLKQLQDSKYYIAFIGPYSTGKSTLINAILQRELLPENLEKATTAFPTYIYPVSIDSIEKADIVYCSQSERDNLKKFYLQLLGNEFSEIEEDMDTYLSMDESELLEELIEIAENYTEYDEKLYDTLCNLLSKWDTNVGETESISVEAVKDYVESNENAIIISKADIYINVSLFSGRKDIVLVDLPGVDADNPRHFDTTKRFTITESKSHAYIFVSAPEKIASSKANEFLLDLGKHTKQISKAFWVLNRCDQFNEKEEVERSVQEFIENNKKKIRDLNTQRVFPVSAKLYKEDPENSNPLTANIDGLRTKFIDYLQDEFEYELAETNQKEYEQLKRTIVAFLETKVGNLKSIPNEDKEMAIELELIQNRLNDWFFDTRQALENATVEIGNKITELDFFNENLIAHIKSKIDKAVAEVGNGDYASISLPKDIEKRSPQSKIIDFQNGVLLNQYIRDTFANALDNDGSLADIMQCFNAFISYKPEIFIEKKAIYSEIIHRFEGICDIVLIGYSYLFDECVSLFIADNDYCHRCFITKYAADDLNNVIRIKVNEKNMRKSILQFVFDSNIHYSTYDLIITELGLKDEHGSFCPTEEDYNNYIQTIVKLKMYVYLETLKIKLNEYVAVCLTNYFKDLFNIVKEMIDSQEFDLKLRLQFTKDLKANRNMIASESEKKSQIATLYTQLT